MDTLLQSSPIFISKWTHINPRQLVFSTFKQQHRSCNLKLRAITKSSQDGSSPVSKDGVLLDTEKDESGSVVGFRFIPQSADDTEISNSHDDISTNDKAEEVIVDDDLGETRRAEVTYNIVFVTSEAAPYSKTGGLGDVCGSLPIALAGRGHRVMVVSPRYMNGGPSDKKFAAAVDQDCRIKVACSGGVQDVAFFHEYRAGVDWVFVDHPSFHRPGNPYGDAYGAFGDNQFRFTLLCHAACEAPLVLPLGGFTYGEKCLFLANDWHAGLVPVLLAAKYHPYGVYKDARSIAVIHNLAHQGVEPASTYSNFGLPPEWYGALGWVFPTWARTHALDTGEAVNILKGALVTADRILTVSQGYSWEITTPEGGYGLNELLTSRKTVVNGITNGIDVTEWNPSSDEHLPSHYTLDDLSGKIECKIALQKELGLPIRPDCPLIGFIGRLDYQKGIDIILSGTPDLLQDDVQFIMLGSGEKQYEDWMRAMEATFKDKFRGWVGFNVPISHRITAGCDILLMPSRFEPCGLNQLYAMRYGTIPVVHETGGLGDTVKTFNPFADEGRGEGTGWAFKPLTRECMLDALRVAIETYRKHKPSWRGLMKRGMERDSSWDNAAVQYEEVFKWAFIDPPYVS
ncbi:soluble starch synthase 1, chloroplastic/amyloplastic-like isoform X1 [Cynara cardunculus var. scolymus]|uniref:soluble starch synthase 1, chloroplastic/amyloplastic-like isoform X1 n=1 Tax=Cynara cardunculus var. scolymus TaxID=59895 RepID=UPI000D629E6D|nr:soluble starch synthase 1, chloroplastic/amyloplastic-like isoform X1 [Cynara cardunculus var. scolymus]